MTSMWHGIRRWLDHRLATLAGLWALVVWALASWRVARSLDTLLGQLNLMAPRRSKISDGSIGDAAHASRSSDHNPWYNRIVTARDFTHDPRNGADMHKFSAQLVKSGDRRIKYIIWDRRIWFPGSGWEAYYGTNPHTSHLHLSVVASSACDSTTPWKLGPGVVKKQVIKQGMSGAKVARYQHLIWARLTPGRLARLRREHGDLKIGTFNGVFRAYVKEFGVQVNLDNSGQIGGRTAKWLDMRTMRNGMSGDDVEWVQVVLRNRKVEPNLARDGDFGDKTEAAVRKYQRQQGMKVDGIVGPATLNTLHRGKYRV